MLKYRSIDRSEQEWELIRKLLLIQDCEPKNESLIGKRRSGKAISISKDFYRLKRVLLKQ